MPQVRPIAIALLVGALLAPALAAHAQSDADAEGLPVTRCDPAANRCTTDTPTFTGQEFGPTGRSTVLSPSRRATEIALEGVGDQVPIPGCGQLAPGTLLCESLHDYQHCRTLMISAMVDSCRIHVAFASGYIEPREAPPGSYELKIESDALVRIKREERGFGQFRGKATVELTLEMPAEATAPAWCLQRDRYLYNPTGPKGGLSTIEDTAGCDEPLNFSFEAHADDLIRAWDLCETFAAWGEEIGDSIEILAAGLFHIRSAAPDFATRYPDGSAIIAPFVTVKAPLTIDCRA
jgi:hypothetical protein